jgi:hypothetical protein
MAALIFVILLIYRLKAGAKVVFLIWLNDNAVLLDGIKYIQKKLLTSE